MQLPKEFLDRMRELIKDDFESFVHSYDTELNSGIRINTLKCRDPKNILEDLHVTGKVEWCHSGYYADRSELSGSHPYHAAGLFYFQEPSAMCAAEAMPLCDDPKILDLCAAPGGKTTQIAARMHNRGLLISNEIIPKRAAILSENVERMGLTNTIVTNESPPALSERFPDFFDGIIVDAPCSGEGIFRKEPQAAEEWSIAHTLSCAVRQKNILDDAYKMLKPGGHIVYSTCTFSYDENEAVVMYMAEKYGMEICDIPELSMLSEGIGEYPGIQKCRRIFPHIQNGEGHFAALLKKQEYTIPASIPRRKSKKNTNKKSNSELDSAIRLYRDFEGKHLNTEFAGEFVLFGSNLYLMPSALDISRLKITRCGLHLGEIKKNRFEPAHALSHAFPANIYKIRADLDLCSQELRQYMTGSVIPGDANGWCVITANGYPIGWGKGSGGIIKNHYPKNLRILK